MIRLAISLTGSADPGLRHAKSIAERSTSSRSTNACVPEGEERHLVSMNYVRRVRRFTFFLAKNGVIPAFEPPAVGPLMRSANRRVPGMAAAIIADSPSGQ